MRGSAALTVGYVHVGRPQHGVSRYGRILAGEARHHADLMVREVELPLESRVENRDSFRRAASSLAGSDVVHLQYNSQLRKSIWGSGWAQLVNIATIIARVRAPVVVSVHDLFLPTSWSVIRGLAATKMTILARHHLARMVRSQRHTEEIPSFGLKAKVRRNFRADALTLRWLGATRCLLVCTHEERKRLLEFVPGARVTVIPHFVEKRVLSMSRDDAKDALGFRGRRVITLLGYIHPRKGHALLIDALACLPPDVVVVVAGRAEPDHAAYLDDLLAASRRAGTADRLRVTGYLPDDELEQYLAATDVAVCPFTATSASGSLSTWLSAGPPILASDLPQIAEYNSIVPGAIETFTPYTVSALSAAILRLLVSDRRIQLAALAVLRERLHISRVLDAHLEVYRQVGRVGSSSPGRRG